EQARLLDLLRGLVRELDLAVVIVTHDLAVARLHRHVEAAGGFVHEHQAWRRDQVAGDLQTLLRGLVRELDLAVVIVTHDLAVARLLADRLMVMRRSRVVEAGLTDQILDDPQHPYTQLLVS
ncbi:phosphonate C-P lyase system protein PhnK, partial [Pseudomonas aeruginosa]